MNTATNPAAVQFIGENLLPGQLGYIFTIVSVVASLVATFSFAKAFYTNEITQQNSWQRLANIAFIIESVSVLIPVGAI